MPLHPELEKFRVTGQGTAGGDGGGGGTPLAVPGYSVVHKRHMCGFCKKVFPLKNLLRKHMRLGCRMNPRSSHFACSFCPYKSTYKANVERHVRNVHETGVLKFCCDLCNFRSNYSFCVRRHMKTFHCAPNADPGKQ
nr:zinc finger protein 513-like [Megalopta genalis]